MKAPDKIYLHGYSFSDEPVKSWEREPKVKRGVTGFKPQYAEYIRKEALLEWANKRLEEFRHIAEISNDVAADGEVDAFEELIDKLNSM